MQQAIRLPDTCQSCLPLHLLRFSRDQAAFCHGSHAVCARFPCDNQCTAPAIPDSVYFTAGLVYPGVGWVIWRNRACVDESLIFKIDYLVSPFLSRLCTSLQMHSPPKAPQLPVPDAAALSWKVHALPAGC